MKIRVKYFASLREKASKDSEELFCEEKTAKELWEALDKKYLFDMDSENVKVAINCKYSNWESTLSNNDEVVFIPPVAGG